MLNLFYNLNFETQIRLVIFIALLVLLIALEVVLPKRGNMARKPRWSANFAIFLLNVVVLALVPVSAISAALVSIEYKFGVFFWLELPFWYKIIASIIVLDLVIYWQHRLFHRFAWGWRIHRMHHTDTAFDVTTALRFHPIEIIASILIKAVFIILLGAPLFAVVLFEIILNGSAMFNHSNLHLPRFFDRLLRGLIVTPDMHRVHHSVDSAEHNSNYGFCLSVWDRIFASYTAQPKLTHEKMLIGLDGFQHKNEMRIDKLLSQPFRN